MVVRIVTRDFLNDLASRIAYSDQQGVGQYDSDSITGDIF